MPKRTKFQLIQGTYFRWRVYRRGGVYQADGRSNSPNAGRHSLGTKCQPAAVEALRRLDLVKAVEFGLADSRLLSENAGPSVDLQTGRSLYLKHCERPEVVGGVRPRTVKRYRAVLNKFIEFAESHGFRSWECVTPKLLTDYLKHLEAQGYAARSQYLEATCVIQVMRWLAKSGHVSESCVFSMSLRKPKDTTTYCWAPAEVDAMITHCRSRPQLKWLAHVIIALARTGLRIGELATLKWSDIDGGMIRLANETGVRRSSASTGRTTKGRRSRVLPVHRELQAVLDEILRGHDGYIFHGPRGGRLKPDTIRTILIRDVIKPLQNQFPSPPGERGFKDGRLHSFRHFFCSASANAGVPVNVIQSWLGHRESSMVTYYYELRDGESRKWMNSVKFAGKFGGNGAA